MRSNNDTAMLSDSVSLADISSADTAENTVSAKSNFSLDRLDLMTKPWWTRLAISLGFVLAALGLTSLLWLVVDRPISAPLFLAAIVGSAWLCGFRAGIFATVVSGIVIDYCFVPPYYQFSASRDEIVRFLIFFSEGSIISWVIEARRVATDAVDRSNKQLRALAEHQQSVRESEQKRIALEIHDELGQALTGLKMEVHLLKRQVDSTNGAPDGAKTSKKLCELSSTIDATIGTVRRIATELRPSILDDFGLIAAMEWQTRESARKSGIRGIFRTDTDHLNLNPQARTAAFRIFQEALTNVVRHSQATYFTVDVDSGGDFIVIAIRDDGVGFVPTALGHKHSLGILGMKERARLIGADFKIYNDDAGGVGVELNVPKSLQLPA
jgi:signal transduction histidine kinase